MDVLKEYEADIENYQRSYEKAGLALLSIKEGDLWVDGDYLSFEEYCEKRWAFTKQRAYQLLSAATFCLELKESTTVDSPPTERICREVLKAKAWVKDGDRWMIDEEKTLVKQRDTWEMVSSQLNGVTMTAEDVRVLVDKSTGRGIDAGLGKEKLAKQQVAKIWRAIAVLATAELTPAQFEKASEGHFKVDWSLCGKKAIKVLTAIGERADG